MAIVEEAQVGGSGEQVGEEASTELNYIANEAVRRRLRSWFRVVHRESQGFLEFKSFNLTESSI